MLLTRASTSLQNAWNQRWVTLWYCMIVICISQIIGKQPDSDVWVFNADVQMDGSENLIPLEQRRFISEGKRNDHVVKIPSGRPNHWKNLKAFAKLSECKANSNTITFAPGWLEKVFLIAIFKAPWYFSFITALT